MLNKYFSDEEYENIKNSKDVTYKTLELITKLFNDKEDKGGNPYVIHLLKVYSEVSDYDEKIVSLLHDVLENTDVSKDDLIVLGYSKKIVDAICILTKHKGEDYRKYIDRIIDSNNICAMNVKLADLKHNMDINRIKKPNSNDYERITKRYQPAYEKILNKINEMEK